MAAPAATPAITLLLAGVAGSARLYEKLSPTEARYAVERCIKRMERAIESCHGRLLESAGGEVLAQFAEPANACLAAIEMQQRVLDLPPASGTQLSIRVGFHAAETSTRAQQLAALLAGYARAGQVLTCGPTLAVLPEALQAATWQPNAGPIDSPAGLLDLVQVLWHADDARPTPSVQSAPSTPSTHSQGLQFLLRYGGREYLLPAAGEAPAILTLGRDRACGVVVQDNRASRQHARIEWQEDRCVLIDTSTNGTYVGFPGEGEIYLKQKALPLRRRGRIAFAAPGSTADADVAEFEVFGGNP